MHLTVVGLSHKTAPVEIREKVTFPARTQAEALSQLCANDLVAEAVIVSTCNRTEIYAVTRDACNGFEVVSDFIAEYHGLDRFDLRRYLYHRQDMGMVDHLFRVVSSLESMVLGEAQILGQVKEGYQISHDNGTTARIFNKLFRSAFEVGKRVRTETGIGENAVSISYAAIELAKRVFDTLAGRTVLIVGAGKMSELTAKHLVSQGVRSVLVANRTYERAVELAERFEGEAIRYDDLFERMATADIVISSTAATGFVITRDQVAKARAGRRGRALFIIDIALPRDVEPSVNELQDVYLYDIDSLSGVVDANLADREREAVRATAIVDEEIATFSAWIQGLVVEPTIAEIRSKGEKIRDAELERAMKHLGDLDDKQRAAVTAMANSIMNKMLHGPTVRLKQVAGDPKGYDHVESARFLYGLDSNPEGKPPHRGLIRNLLGLAFDNNRGDNATTLKQSPALPADGMGESIGRP